MVEIRTAPDKSVCRNRIQDQWVADTQLSLNKI